MASLSTVPYAILPSLFQETHLDEEDNTSDIHRSIFVLFENKRYELSNLFKAYHGAWCVGSSQNFLVFLDNNGCPSLLNPSSNICFNLPHFPNSLIRRANVPSYSYYVEQLRKIFVTKAALMCSPSPSQYTLAIMYGTYPLCKIAFSSNRRASWVELFDANRRYCDIVFHNNNLYALTGDCSIEGWDFRQQVPRKILYADYYPIMEKDKEEETKFPIDKFSTRLYLVISKGDFFFIERFIGNFVNAYGEVVYEGSNLSYEGNEVCPYRTKHFSVYKLVKKRWEKIKSLDGGVIFVGVNESKFVAKISGCEGNLIYFSDDRWEEMNLDYSYGGHDWGVFNLEDSSIKLLAPYANKMDPPPIWMVPTNSD